VRWGSEEGTKLRDLNTGPGDWFIAPVYQEVSAARAWTGNWDVWRECSDEAKGVMLEHYRTGKRMEAWELREQQRKAKANR